MTGFLQSIALLVIGAILTGLLIPFITRQWQQQQKALDVKAELINDMTHLAAEMMEEKSMVAALAVIELSKAAGAPILKGYSGPEGDFVSRTNNWSMKRIMIRSRLKVYFPDPHIVRSWEQLTTALLNYLWLDHHPVPQERNGLVNNIKEFIGDKVDGVDWHLVAAIRDDLESLDLRIQQDRNTMRIGNALAFELDALIEQVMKSCIYGEFRLRELLDL